MTVAIVALTFGRIAEHLVGFRGLLEFDLGLRIADVAIGMMLHGQLAIGPFDILVVRILATPRTS